MVGFIAAAALAVSSQVSDVTVYSDRAQVVRTAQVELAGGMNTVVFDDLPKALDSRGIQVEGSGAATVLDVRFKTENFKEVPDEAWQALYAGRDALQEKEQAINQRIERLRQAKSFLSKISNKVTHRADKEGELELNPESWEKMLSLYAGKGAEYDEGIQQAELELRELRKDLEKVMADIRDAGAGQHRQRRIVEVDLEAAEPGKVELRLAYLVSGPSWKPTYDVRVNTKSREMEVKYFALVRQNTGEDWSDVALKLSTANPGLGGQHPDLQPWRIGMRATGDREGPYGSSLGGDFDLQISGMEPSAMSNVFAPEDMDSLFGASDKPIMVRQATVRQRGASVVFEVTGRNTIDADNVEHRVAVSSTVLPAHFRYSAVPKMDKHAYLKAKAVNRSETPFLAGKANIFLDGSYVTSSALDLVAPEEEFWVFLGADESMKVEYKRIKKFTSREGLTGRTVRHAFEYLLTVQNTHANAEEVIVWDQLPISGNEAIEIELVEPKYSKDTDALKIDDEQRIQWFQSVEPGTTWEIPFSFHVEAPKDVKITGLE